MGKRVRRIEERYPAELGLSLSDASGRPLDPRARAWDVTTGGFRAQTRAALREGSRLLALSRD